MANPYYKIEAKTAQHKPEAVAWYPMAEFVMTMLLSQTNAHILHLKSRSYSEHKALQAYYEGIDSLIDDYVETYQGIHGLIEDYSKREVQTPDNPLEYMISLSEYLLNGRPHMPQQTELCNILDEITALIDRTIYKLKFLE